MYDIRERFSYHVKPDTLYKVVLPINHKNINSDFYISSDVNIITPIINLDDKSKCQSIIKKNSGKTYNIDKFTIYIYTDSYSKLYIYSANLYFDDIEFINLCEDIKKNQNKFNIIYKNENIIKTSSPEMRTYYSNLYNICVRNS